MSTSLGTVLALGSGLVAKPGAQYLAENGFKVVVASRNLETAEKLCKQAKTDSKNENLPISAAKCDVEQDDEVLEKLVTESDFVISLLPYVFHVKAAKLAIKHKKQFFTTSYVSDEMKKLQQEALDAGIILLNECGVDPGTDHVHKEGGKIEHFTSYCGGLPAPEDNDNPFGYKLSWAPRGVLLASRNDAYFLENGKDVKIEGKDLFDNYKFFQTPIGEYEGYPNRNSKNYIDIYKIPEVQTIVRGTFRNKGWCRTIKKIADLGFLSVDEMNLEGKTYQDLMETIVGKSENLKEKVSEKIGLKSDDEVLTCFEWIGLLSNEKIPAKTNTKLDALCHLFKNKLVYKDGQTDMILMQHTFTAKYENKSEIITSTLIDYGIKNSDTSMSRTVSLPVAICVKLVATGKVKLTGLQTPVIPELYNPILDELESMGIKFIEEFKTKE
eukprot:gene11864-5193_t